MNRSHFNTEEIRAELDKIADKLSRAQHKYLRKKYAHGHFRAAIIKVSEGKSYAEKEMNAEATEMWKKLADELADAESVYDHYTREYKRLQMAHQDAYLKEKMDSEMIKVQS